MSSRHEHVAITSNGKPSKLVARVDPHPDGGWLAVVGLGDGASVSCWRSCKSAEIWTEVVPAP